MTVCKILLYITFGLAFIAYSMIVYSWWIEGNNRAGNPPLGGNVINQQNTVDKRYTVD